MAEYPLLTSALAASAAGSIYTLRRQYQTTGSGRISNARKDTYNSLDNFYNTRRPDTKYLSYDQMPTYLGSNRSRYQKGYGKGRQYPKPAFRAPHVPRSLKPKDEIFINVINMKEFTADGSGNIAGVIQPQDVLGCARMSRFVNTYQYVKLHTMSVEFLGSHPSFIMTCFDTDSGEVQNKEPHFERQGSLRLHRSTDNKISSRTQSLQFKPGFQDYFKTQDLSTEVAAAANSCSIKFLAPNLYLSYASGTSDQLPPKMSVILKFKVSFYGIKEVLPGNQDTNSQITVITE
jgi:hypothetical protein